MNLVPGQSVWKRHALVAALVLTACSFDTAGTTDGAGLGDGDADGSTGGTASSSGEPGGSMGGSGGNGTSGVDPSGPDATTTDTTTGPDPTDPTVDPSTSTTDPSGSETTDSTDPTDPTDAEPAALELDGDDFGTLGYAAPETRDYTLSNVGGQAATALVLEASGPFDIDAEDCPDALDMGDSCTITVRHDAATLGPFAGELAVDYDSGAAAESVSVSLSTDVQGSTDNLLPEGTFEGCDEVWDSSETVLGWRNVGTGRWECTDATASGSNVSVAAYDNGANDTDHILRTNVDVSEYAEAIATGNMRFSFSGDARSAVFGDNEYAIRIRYRNGSGTVLEVGTGYTSTGSWQTIEDETLAPTDTEVIRVELMCRKPFGEFCDAFFDNLELVGTYPEG